MSVQTIDYGRRVECDWCGKDFTDSKATGGLLFQSKAVCPECVPTMERAVISYGEQRFIRARCPINMPFADWVRDVVCGGEKREVKILTGEDFPK